MPFPKTLLVVLAVLSIGVAMKVIAMMTSDSVSFLSVGSLVFSVVTIGGILARSRTGWYVGIAYFVVIILQVLDHLFGDFSLLTPWMAAALCVVPTICLLCLFITRAEFE